jgi:RNA polymerase sigma-70 factor (ECF subfamily)
MKSVRFAHNASATNTIAPVSDVSAIKTGAASLRAVALDDVVLGELMKEMNKSLYYRAFRMTGEVEDAKDVQQQTWLNVYRRFGQFKGHSRIGTWVNKVAINEALMLLRRRRSLCETPLDEAIWGISAATAGRRRDWSLDGPEGICWRNELRCLLKSAIASLNPALRAAFIVRIVEEQSTKEAARTLRISQGGVRKRMRLARQELRQYLQNSGF